MAKKLILKNVRFSFVRVFEARENNFTNEMEYSVDVLLPKSDKVQVKKVKEMIKAINEEILEKNASKFKGKLPPAWREPLKDGDEVAKEKGWDAYEGMYVLTPKRKEEDGRPLCVDKNKQAITVKEDMYSGCWGTVSMNMYGYTKGTGGVTLALNGLQKVTDDERLDGGGSLNDFDNEGDEDDETAAFMNDLNG